MRKDIHPTYQASAKIVCSCGNEVVTGSTMPEMRVEICSNCHPFYTKQDKLVDTQGRVEKFKAKVAEAAKRQQAKKPKKTRKKDEESAPEQAEA